MSLIILAALLITAGIDSFAAKKNKDTDIPPENQRKASYIFFEALNQKQKSNIDAFFDLLRHAHRLNPDDSAISFYLGFCYISMNNGTKEMSETGLAMMKKHFIEHPEDYDEAVIYATVAGQLGMQAESLKAWEKITEVFPSKIEAKSLLAECYARNNDFRRAIATYDTIESIEGKSMALSLRKINYMFALDDTTGTITEGRALLASAPDNASYNLLMGNIFMQLGNQDSAFHYIDKAQKLDPENGMTYLTKAQIYYMDGDSINYDKQIYQALVSKDLDVNNKVAVLTDYIKQLLAERDSSQRIDNLFSVLITQHPHESTIHDLYSQYFATKGEYTKAAEQLAYVTDIDPDNPNAWKKLVMLYLMSEDFPQAVTAAQKALEYNPDDMDLYQYIAPAYYQMKEYDKALKTYNKALEISDSTDYVLRSNIIGGMADVYYSMGDTLKAFDTYEKSLELYPGNTSIMNNYAYFLSVSNMDLDRAEKLSAIAVKDDPENPIFLDTYAWVFFKKKEYKLALAYIENAIKNSKEESAEILEHYGDILFMNGQFEKAVENWEKALKLDPKSDILQRKVKYKTYFIE